MRNNFLKIFAKTELAEQLVELVLQPDLDNIKDVTNEDDSLDATNGEKYIGKKIAAKMIQDLIDDILYYKNIKQKEKNPKDQMN